MAAAEGTGVQTTLRLFMTSEWVERALGGNKAKEASLNGWATTQVRVNVWVTVGRTRSTTESFEFKFPGQASNLQSYVQGHP